MKLQTNGIPCKAMAKQARLVHGVLALPDQLLCLAPLIVEALHVLGFNREVSYYKSKLREKVTGMSSNLDHDAALLIS